MSELIVKSVCPRGMRGCEYIENNQPHRCKLYIGFPMMDRVTKLEEVKFDCADNWAARFGYLAIGSIESGNAVAEQLRNIVAGPELQFPQSVPAVENNAGNSTAGLLSSEDSNGD